MGKRANAKTRLIEEMTKLAAATAEPTEQAFVEQILEKAEKYLTQPELDESAYAELKQKIMPSTPQTAAQSESQSASSADRSSAAPPRKRRALRKESETEQDLENPTEATADTGGETPRSAGQHPKNTNKRGAPKLIVPPDEEFQKKLEDKGLPELEKIRFGYEFDMAELQTRARGNKKVKNEEHRAASRAELLALLPRLQSLINASSSKLKEAHEKTRQNERDLRVNLRAADSDADKAKLEKEIELLDKGREKDEELSQLEASIGKLWTGLQAEGETRIAIRTEQQKFRRWCSANEFHEISLQAAEVRSNAAGRQSAKNQLQEIMDKWSREYGDEQHTVIEAQRTETKLKAAEELAARATWQSYDHFERLWPNEEYREVVLNKFKKRKNPNRDVLKLVAQKKISAGFEWEYLEVLETKSSFQKKEFAGIKSTEKTREVVHAAEGDELPIENGAE